MKADSTTDVTGWGDGGAREFTIVDKGAVAHIARLARRCFDAPLAVVAIGYGGEQREMALAGSTEDRATALVHLFEPLLEGGEGEPVVIDVARFFDGDDNSPTVDGAPIRKVIASALGSDHLYGEGVIWIFDDESEAVTEDLLADLQAMTSLLSDELQMRGANEALEDSNRRLNMILKVIPDVLIFAEPDRRITTVNQGFSDHFGYRPDEIVGHTTRRLYADPEDYDRTASRYQPGASDREEPYRIRYRRKDGSTFVGETIGVHVRDEQGHTLGYLGLIEDVTESLRMENERREAIKKLRRSEELLRETSHMAGVGGGEYRADKEELNWSDELYRLHDLPPGTPLTLPETLNFFDDQGQRHIDEAVEHTLSTGASFDVEACLTTARGRKRVVRVKGKPIEENGVIVGVTGYHQDITEQKQAAQAKREFISVVSHELRTPLTSIRGTLGLVAGGVVGELPEEAEELLTIALKNTDRLTAIIDDLLDMEKMESGKLQLELRPTQAARLVDETIESNHHFAADAQVTLRSRVAEELPRICVDPDRAHQVLTNFVSNAVKYSSIGDAVDVEAFLVEPKVVRIAVRDRGPGIPEQFREHLFERFTQADSTDARRRQGTGLGLSIAKALTEEMGGRIGFETVEGEGTTIFADFPVVADETTTRRGESRPIGG